MISQHLNKDNLHHAYLIEGVRDEVVPEIIKFLEMLNVDTVGNPDFIHISIDNLKIDEAFDLRAMSADKSLPAQAGGYFFVRALAKDGNKNVKNLLKASPGKEYNTYIIKEIGLTERVFSREDFTKMYSQYFKILRLEKKTSYTTLNNRIYKRNYWLAYLSKQ